MTREVIEVDSVCILDDIGEVWAWDGERLFLVSAELEGVEQNGEPCPTIDKAIEMLFDYWYIAP